MRPPRAPEPTKPTDRSSGFTLLELMISVAILAVIATIAVPNYRSAVRSARFQKARSELRSIATEIDLFRAAHGGALPLTLSDVGLGGKRDPWGTPYCYLNFAEGTGDGLEWAVEHGLVDPSALDGEGKTVLAGDLLLRQDMILSGAPISDTAPGGGEDDDEGDSGAPIDVTNVKRRDSYLFPLNSDYDLFSLGPNRDSHASLGNQRSQDDVIRANDGGYFGQASKY